MGETAPRTLEPPDSKKYKVESSTKDSLDLGISVSQVGFGFYSKPKSLDRTLTKFDEKTGANLVICHCQGTSKEVAACLKTTESFIGDENFHCNNRSIWEKYHMGARKVCAKLGLNRISNLYDTTGQ